MELRLRAVTAANKIAVVAAIVSLTAILFVLIVPSQTSALRLPTVDLPRDTTDLIKQLLGADDNVAEPSDNTDTPPAAGSGTPSPTSSSANSLSTPADATSSNSIGAGSVAGELLATVQPLNVDLHGLQPASERLSQIDSSNGGNEDFFGISVGGSVAASSGSAALQASGNGWELFGVPWYVWLVGGGSLVWLVRAGRRLHDRKQISGQGIN